MRTVKRRMRSRSISESEYSNLALLWGVSVANCAWSLADAQLALLRAWKAFVEVGCLKPVRDGASRGRSSDVVRQRIRGNRTSLEMAQVQG